jgi:predicted ATPase
MREKYSATLDNHHCSLVFLLVALLPITNYFSNDSMFDDFQWIEPNSLEWVTTQMGDSKIEASLFFATLNDKDDTNTSAGHNLWGGQIDKWKQQENVVLTEIYLDNLDEESAHEMVSEMLMMSADKDDDAGKSISSWIYEQTKGNPRYVEELMLGLYEQGLLRYDDGIDKWVLVQPCAVSMLPNEDAIATSSSPVSMYLAHAKLSKLREGLKEVLKVAACLGYRFETKLVAAALTKSSSTAATPTTNDYLEMARDAGIIVNGGGSFHSKGACRFVHNSMHKAALLLVGQDRSYFHLKMARALLRNLSDEDVEADLLTISGQVIFGAGAIKRKEEKYQCAQIALRAAQTSVRLASFKSAQKSICFAIDMLDTNQSNAAWRDEYDLTLALFNAAAEVAYANGDFDIVEMRIDSVLKHARSFEDKLQANSTKLYMLGAMDRVDDAIELGFALLKELGEPFPKVANKGSILRSLYKTKLLLNGKSDGALLRSPVMTDPRVTSAMQIMNILFSSVFVGKPMVAPLLAMRMVQLSLTHGFCAISCFAFSVYGMLLCSQGANVEEGTRFGDLSLRLLDRFQAKEFIPRVYAAVHGFIYGWSRPYKQSFEPLMRGYRVGLETGDMEVSRSSALMQLQPTEGSATYDRLMAPFPFSLLL